jgi:pyocin large subunit-like protein
MPTPNSRIRNSLLAACFFGCAAAALAGGQGFRNGHLLRDHFVRYGHDFGEITPDRYLHLAQQLRDSRAGGNILESKRPDGMIRFDRKHGYFGSYEVDGTIRTFFIPSDGIRFFERETR